MTPHAPPAVAPDNQVDELVDVNLWRVDPALQAAVRAAGGGTFEAQLDGFGHEVGSAASYAEAALANRHGPVHEPFDARGRRIDAVRCHPAWHAVLARFRGAGFVALPFQSARPGRWAAWAAGFYLQGQVEAGVLCPATMTMAAIPVLRRHAPALWSLHEHGLLSNAIDERDRPAPHKRALWVGMGMTEKQGGSDVRANTTLATPAGGDGGLPGALHHTLRGHKWFFSVPMSDAHLVVARTADDPSPSCFWVPRLRLDGTRNAVRIQRLKDKVGNRSNASSEVEFHDADGWLVGQPGRGIPTIIEMAMHTRLNCVLGSAALLRQGVVQGLAYTRRRHAFGRALAEQPLMRAVLADAALESEAAMALGLRIAGAFERQHDAEAAGRPVDALDRAWQRIVTPAAKFWVCKRAVMLAGELMEVFGGNGYVDDSIVARLYREAPVNSIWEGSGNVMCLDVLRALSREPEAAAALFADLNAGAGDDARLCTALGELQAMATTLPPEALEAQARSLAEQLVLLAQAVLLRRGSPGAVADGFAATRFEPRWGRVTGAVDTRALDVAALLQRALPA